MPTRLYPEDAGSAESIDSSSVERRRGRIVVKVNINANSNLASWHFACTHASELPAAQQQALQELGCSGRVFMYVAAHTLTPHLSTKNVLHISLVYLQIARHQAE